MTYVAIPLAVFSCIMWGCYLWGLLGVWCSTLDGDLRLRYAIYLTLLWPFAPVLGVYSLLKLIANPGSVHS